MSELSVYMDLAVSVGRRALAGDDGFVPLRSPAVAPVGVEDAVTVCACDSVPLDRAAVTPGMRCIGGEWFYSAAWL